MNSSLSDRLRAAGRVARERGYGWARFEERKPGVKTRIVSDCEYRGAVKDVRDIPCCGGKVRREELFACSHPGNDQGDAWAIMCQGCVLVRDGACQEGFIAEAT